MSQDNKARRSPQVPRELLRDWHEYARALPVYVHALTKLVDEDSDEWQATLAALQSEDYTFAFKFIGTLVEDRVSVEEWQRLEDVAALFCQQRRYDPDWDDASDGRLDGDGDEPGIYDPVTGVELDDEYMYQCMCPEDDLDAVDDCCDFDEDRDLCIVTENHLDEELDLDPNEASDFDDERDVFEGVDCNLTVTHASLLNIAERWSQDDTNPGGGSTA